MGSKKASVGTIEQWLSGNGRKMLFRQAHRYFRAHMELLEDPVYKEIYEYCRATLIAYFRRDLRDEELKQQVEDEQIGKVIDLSADFHNKERREDSPFGIIFIDALYKAWRKKPDLHREIIV